MGVSLKFPHKKTLVSVKFCTNVIIPTCNNHAEAGPDRPGALAEKKEEKETGKEREKEEQEKETE